jgi:hypothetical protein
MHHHQEAENGWSSSFHRLFCFFLVACLIIFAHNHTLLSIVLFHSIMNPYNNTTRQTQQHPSFGHGTERGNGGQPARMTTAGRSNGATQQYHHGNNGRHSSSIVGPSTPRPPPRQQQQGNGKDAIVQKLQKALIAVRQERDQEHRNRDMVIEKLRSTKETLELTKAAVQAEKDKFSTTVKETDETKNEIDLVETSLQELKRKVRLSLKLVS